MGGTRLVPATAGGAEGFVHAMSQKKMVTYAFFGGFNFAGHYVFFDFLVPQMCSKKSFA